MPVRRVSVSTGENGLELVLRFDEGRPPERLTAELSALADVVEVVDGVRTPTRELVIARLRPGARPPVEQQWRLLSNGSDGCIVELSGSPEEVAGALDRLRAEGLLASALRSGEIAIPMEGDGL
jgi:acetolactate synthase small subunit